MENDKAKKNIIIVGILLLLIIGILGVSYAVFNYTGRGERVNTITSGAISMSYEETDNIITMEGALPTTDETGTKRLNEGEYFDFTISGTTTGNTNINYEISAKDVTDSSVRKIDGSNIKLYLTRITEDGSEQELMSPEIYNEETNENTYTGRPADEMSLYTSSMSSSESNRYRLRMYVDEVYNPQGDGGGLTFSVKINVYGKAGDPMPEAGNTIIENLTSGSTYDDGTDTFITGTNPNNYIWYSGKLWRAVSINNETKTTKLVTQWNISAINYNEDGNTAFAGSYMEDWLNDTSVDGFLGNLREPNNFIVTDSVWDTTMDDTSLGSIEKPNGTTTVTNAVGLLNMYEYQTSYHGTTYQNGYLNNGLNWWVLTPSDMNFVWYLHYTGNAYSSESYNTSGVRPSINLKSSVIIVDGTGTETDPYRLAGDNDTNLNGTLLNTRYSGEYIKFGNAENNLYRIVSHENGEGTKIVSAEPIKSSGTFITSAFGSNVTFSSANTIGTFLNGDYLNSYVDSSYSEIIEESTTWYLGTVAHGSSYILAKYKDVNRSSYVSSTESKVGILRLGELMAGQFERYALKGESTSTGLTTTYWTLTALNSSGIYSVGNIGNAAGYTPEKIHSIRPSLNLKSNVIITSGDGTKENPFEIALQ